MGVDDVDEVRVGDGLVGTGELDDHRADHVAGVAPRAHPAGGPALGRARPDVLAARCGAPPGISHSASSVNSAAYSSTEPSPSAYIATRDDRVAHRPLVGGLLPRCALVVHRRPSPSIGRRDPARSAAARERARSRRRRRARIRADRGRSRPTRHPPPVTDRLRLTARPTWGALFGVVPDRGMRRRPSEVARVAARRAGRRRRRGRRPQPDPARGRLPRPRHGPARPVPRRPCGSSTAPARSSPVLVVLAAAVAARRIRFIGGVVVAAGLERRRWRCGSSRWSTPRPRSPPRHHRRHLPGLPEPAPRACSPPSSSSPPPSSPARPAASSGLLLVVVSISVIGVTDGYPTGVLGSLALGWARGRPGAPRLRLARRRPRPRRRPRRRRRARRRPRARSTRARPRCGASRPSSPPTADGDAAGRGDRPRRHRRPVHGQGRALRLVQGLGPLAGAQPHPPDRAPGLPAPARRAGRRAAPRVVAAGTAGGGKDALLVLRRGARAARSPTVGADELDRRRARRRRGRRSPQLHDGRHLPRGPRRPTGCASSTTARVAFTDLATADATPDRRRPRRRPGRPPRRSWPPPPTRTGPSPRPAPRLGDDGPRRGAAAAAAGGAPPGPAEVGPRREAPHRAAPRRRRRGPGRRAAGAGAAPPGVDRQHADGRRHDLRRLPADRPVQRDRLGHHRSRAPTWRGSRWWSLFSQLPQIGNSIAMLGSVNQRLPLRPVVGVNFANQFTGFIGGSVANAALAIRFFQRQGMTAAVAVSSGVLVSLAALVVPGHPRRHRPDRSSAAPSPGTPRAATGSSSSGSSGTDTQTFIAVLLLDRPRRGCRHLRPPHPPAGRPTR